MKPVRWLLLGALLTVPALLGALPELEAQQRSGSCQYSVSVQHIRVQNQQTQYVQQQQMQQQQMQQYRQQQQYQMMQQQQLQTQRQQLQQQQTAVHTRSNTLTQKSTQLHTTSHQMHTQTMAMNTASRQLHTTGMGLYTRPVALHTTSMALHTSANQLHTTSKSLHTTSMALHTASKTLNTQSVALHTKPQALHTQSMTLNTKAQTLNTQSVALNTKAKTLCTSTDITIVTINMNCAACHKKMVPTGPQPGMQQLVRQPDPTNYLVSKTKDLPNLVTKLRPMPYPVAQLPKMPTPVTKPLPLPMPVTQQLVMNRPNFPMPVTKQMTQLPTPVFKPGVVQLPQMVGQPLVRMPQPLLPLPVYMTYNPPSPGTSKTTDSFMTTQSSSSPRKSLAEATPTTGTNLVQELPMAIETAKPRPVMTQEVLAQAPELLMPISAQPLAVVGNVSRLQIPTEFAAVEPEAPAKTVALPPLSADELERPALPTLPRSVWLPPVPAADVIEDFDRDPPAFAADQPLLPLRGNLLSATNTGRSPLSQPLDGPPLLALPGGPRTLN